MNKKLIYISLMLLLMIPTLSNGLQEKDIYLLTGGKIGHLIYEESYYDNKFTNLTFVEARRYFDGNINKPNVRFMIIRPLDKSGNEYSENQIRAYATLDNVTILNTWYGSSSIEDNVHMKSDQDSRRLQLIGFLTILMIIIFSGFIFIKVMNKVKSSNEKNQK